MMCNNCYQVKIRDSILNLYRHPKSAHALTIKVPSAPFPAMHVSFGWLGLCTVRMRVHFLIFHCTDYLVPYLAVLFVLSHLYKQLIPIPLTPDGLSHAHTHLPTPPPTRPPYSQSLAIMRAASSTNALGRLREGGVICCLVVSGSCFNMLVHGAR